MIKVSLNNYSVTKISLLSHLIRISVQFYYYQYLYIMSRPAGHLSEQIFFTYYFKIAFTNYSTQYL